MKTSSTSQSASGQLGQKGPEYSEQVDYMNGVGATQLDIFLRFSELRLLIFSSHWKLLGIRPTRSSFLGWDLSIAESFNFQEVFLAPNKLELSQFLGRFNHSDAVVKKYFWKDVNEQTSGPYETFFRIKQERGQIKSLMAFVKLSEKTDKVEIPPHDKHHLFLARNLPGLIHNINGPLGTLTGRIELLNIKYQKIPEFSELLKMGFKIQSMLENLSFKLVNERYFQPVEINLNRLLREELKFLTTDIFFKHQVEVEEKFCSNIPQFRLYYLSISGILSECYHFFRSFVYEDQEYQMQVGSFYEDGRPGYFLNFLGEFHTPQDTGLKFPISLSGDAIKIAHEKLEKLDTSFLSFCLKQNKGHLQLSGRKNMLNLRMDFELPTD